MSAHTPGPWTVSGYRVFGPSDSQSKHPNGLTLIGGVVDDTNDWRGEPSNSRDERDRFAAETTANARLIAAAPDLLAAAKYALSTAEAFISQMSDEGDVIARCMADLEPCRMAIAKAEGRA